LGNGSTKTAATPVAVSGLSSGDGAVAITTGAEHACALLGNGTVTCWGANGDGQLGNDSIVDSDGPVAVADVANAVSVSAGGGHTCALLANGTVACWGDDANGELGNGTHASSVTAAPVEGIGGTSRLTGVRAISAGSDHSCALMSDGSVTCWGDNTEGDLGSGSTTSSSTPVRVTGVAGAGRLAGVRAISAGGDHTCALMTAGTVNCWGFNDSGQLGDGTNIGPEHCQQLGVACSTAPVGVFGVGRTGLLSGVTAISAGLDHSCALSLPNGTVRCWGTNSIGQLGIGSSNNFSATPASVRGINGSGSLRGAIALSAGDLDTCVSMLPNGISACWGDNAYGQLGNNTDSGPQSCFAAQFQAFVACSTTPVPVLGVGGIGTLNAVTELSVGGNSSCALIGNGTADCWGLNTDGELGDETTTTSSTPTVVGGVPHQSTTIAIEARGNNTCALSIGGTVQCWGNNDYGQLGNGTLASSSTPVAVQGLTNAVAVATGYDDACALLADGTAECWGHNGHGDLGNGTLTDSSTPVAVLGLTHIVALTANGFHTCALLSDETVKCWGDNEYGQLGNGTLTDSPTPVAVQGLIHAVAISAGYNHSCALLDDETVTCWGYNTNGQLGNGTLANSSTPVAVQGLTTALAVSAADNHTCALLANQTAACWGQNSSGQLGNGTMIASSTPVAVIDLTNAVEIAADGLHSCALRADGTAACWGDNSSGELGNGTLTDSLTPVAVSGLTGAAAVTAGDFHSCALLADMTAVCWGQNTFGQLGNNTNTDSTVPVKVSGT